MAGNKAGKGSLIFGLILIVLGGLFFVDDWLGVLWFWSLLATWWPVLLIAIGLRKIYRYFSWNVSE